jgi:hypothetical protein
MVATVEKVTDNVLDNRGSNSSLKKSVRFEMVPSIVGLKHC